MTREERNNFTRGDKMNTNVKTGNFKPDTKQAFISDDMWLNYYNDFLFKNGIITSDEQRKMSEFIMKKYPISEMA